jgi:hypothetical protein
MDFSNDEVAAHLLEVLRCLSFGKRKERSELSDQQRANYNITAAKLMQNFRATKSESK